MSIIHDALKKAGSADPGRPPLSISTPKHLTRGWTGFPIKRSPALTAFFFAALIIAAGWGLYRLLPVRTLWTHGRPRSKPASSAPSTMVETPSSRAADVIPPPVKSEVPGRAERLRAESLSAFASGDMAAAERKFSELLALTPNDAGVHNNYGLALRRLGRLAEAEVEYQRAMALRPSYAEAMNNLALLLEESGRTDEAGVWFAKSVETDPSYAVGHLNYGLFLERFGSLKEARAHYTRFLAVANPEQADLAAKVRDRLARLGASER